MSAADRQRWDAKYAGRTVSAELAADAWLVDKLATSVPGCALELACGLGHNAVWLATAGWRVEAVDISPVGLCLAKKLAAKERQHVTWIEADLDNYTAVPNSYDLVSVFRFLDRAYLPTLVQSALRPGGLLVYETFTSALPNCKDNHPHNPAYTLSEGELPTLFPRLSVVEYRELELEDRPMAQLLAKKPIAE